MKIKIKNKELGDFWISFGVGIQVFLFGLFLFSMLIFAFGGKVSAVSLYLSVGLVVIFRRFISHNSHGLFFWLLFFVVSVLLLCICNIFYDLTYDGQSYHQEAVTQLAWGWNPIMQKISPDVWDHTYAIWLNHFPKFSWTTSAVVYKVFNKIEMAKVINWYFIVAVFSVSFGFFIQKTKSFVKAFLFALIMAFNPVSISQMNSFCLDSQLASLFSLLSVEILMYFDKEWRNKLFVRLILIITLVMIMNIKMTALAYLFVVFIGIMIWILFNKLNWVRWFKLWVVAGLLGVFVLGFDPYITNTISYGHPFYPMFMNSQYAMPKMIVPAYPEMTDVRKFIYDSNMPGDFINKNRWWKFFRSYFSESYNLASYSIDGKKAFVTRTTLKWPFSVNKDELGVFKDSDVRVAGFGVMFSGCLVVAIIIMIIAWFFNYKKRVLILLGMSLLILSASFINPEAWWARYVPFLWLIPFFVTYSFINDRVMIIRIGSWLLISLMSIDIILIGYVMLKFQFFNSRYRFHYAQNLAGAFQLSSDVAVMNFGPTRANRVYYGEMGVNYVESSLEIGIVENQMWPFMTISERDIFINSYIKNDLIYKYELKNDIDKEGLVELSKVFKKTSNVLYGMTRN